MEFQMNYIENDSYGAYKVKTEGGPGPGLIGADTLVGNDAYKRQDENLGDVKKIMLEPVTRWLLRLRTSMIAPMVAMLLGLVAINARADDPPLNAVPSAPAFGTNAAGAVVLNEFTVTIPISTAIPVGADLQIDWPVPVTDPANPTGPKVKTTKIKVGPAGVTKIKVPDEAEGLGTKVTISVKRAGTVGIAEVSETTFTWKHVSNFGFGGPKVVVLQSPTPPGNGPQHWHIPNPGDVPIEQTDLKPGTQIVGSGFDLSYSLAGGNTYNVTVAGNDSFIRLSDGTYITFADASLFGTIEIDANANSGLFDFTAIGSAGTWLYDTTTNETHLEATQFSQFGAATLSTVPVPEPSTLWLTLAALAAFFGITKRIAPVKPKLVSTQSFAAAVRKIWQQRFFRLNAQVKGHRLNTHNLIL
jgi:hypothetical protein